MEPEQNFVELWGRVEALPLLSHENHSRQFYKFPLCVERLSGQADHPVILVSGTQLRSFPLHIGDPLRVAGSLRSFNNKSGQGSRLLLSVFAETLSRGDGEFRNCVLLSGTLCRKPHLRRTPLGRSICDITLAVNRRYGRADYLPCIAWGQTASEIAEMDVGERLSFEGRFQSRDYLKMIDGEAEKRTAFEVSVMELLTP